MAVDQNGPHLKGVQKSLEEAISVCTLQSRLSFEEITLKLGHTNTVGKASMVERYESVGTV